MKRLRAKPIERLVDASPAWSGDDPAAGIGFKCPIHEGCYVSIPFAPRHPNGWARSGSSFDDLTVSPSIKVRGDLSNGPDEDRCCWHGFIRNGRFETCGDAR